METSGTTTRAANMPFRKAEIIATTEEAEEVVAIKAKAEAVGAATRKMAQAGSNVEVAVISNSVVTRTGSATLSSSLKESPRIKETMRIGAITVVSVIVEVEEDVVGVEAVETVTTPTVTMPVISVVDVVVAAITSPTALMSVKMNRDKANAETTTMKIAPTSPTKIKVRLRLRSRLPTHA